MGNHTQSQNLPGPMFREKLVLVMKVKKLLTLSCSEAEEFCDKVQYQEAGLLTKAKLRLHLLFCRTCKDYTRKNLKLTALLKKASLKTCTKQEKERYKKQIKENL